MNKKTDKQPTLESDIIHELKLDEVKQRNLSLSEQTKMASYALLISKVLEILYDLIKGRSSKGQPDPDTLKSGIEFIKQLMEGELYLSQMNASLTSRPEYVETVGHIKEQTSLNVTVGSETAINVLNQIIAGDDIGSVARKEIEITRDFLRATHAGIMDQLETVDNSS